ncbi:RNA-binding family protein [Trifolium medium]|uniref:RNA-binding family protein n=1 Tax=Trifolium medium TaxID=97028 RepID=A0A392PFJ9_9FABA|nr:RNA-binding family protein [Trifolium medium]
MNGKMVEVKRAVPKESSPGPTCSHLSGYNYDTRFRLVSATSSSII